MQFMYLNDNIYHNLFKIINHSMFYHRCCHYGLVILEVIFVYICSHYGLAIFEAIFVYYLLPLGMNVHLGCILHFIMMPLCISGATPSFSSINSVLDYQMSGHKIEPHRIKL